MAFHVLVCPCNHSLNLHKMSTIISSTLQGNLSQLSSASSSLTIDWYSGKFHLLQETSEGWHCYHGNVHSSKHLKADTAQDMYLNRSYWKKVLVCFLWELQLLNNQTMFQVIAWISQL